jgi:hypothetical protein
VTTFDINHPFTDSTQTINRCFNPEASLILQSRESADLAIESVDVSGEKIRLSTSLRLAVDFLHVMYIKGKQMLVLNFIF